MADAFSVDDATEQTVKDAFMRDLACQTGARGSLALLGRWLPTPIGSMLAVGDERRVYMLSFLDKSSLPRKVGVLRKKLGATLDMGETEALRSIERELAEYFAGRRRVFETPLRLVGTAFQTSVWETLREFPFGRTIAYAELAERIGKPAAFRAVAQANALNPAAIAVPCHRVVNSTGDSGGYNAGMERKRRLLAFEGKQLAEDAGMR